MANNDTYILTGTETVSAGLSAPTGATLSFVSDLGFPYRFFVLPGNFIIVRMYSYKTINGVNVFSASYNQSNTLTSAGAGNYSIKLTYTAASGVDGYMLIFSSNMIGFSYTYTRTIYAGASGSYNQLFSNNPAYLSQIISTNIPAMPTTYDIDKEEIYVDGVLIAKGTTL